MYGLGVRRSGGGLLVAVAVPAFAAVFHYGVFTFVDAQPGPVWEGTEGWDPSRKKMVGFVAPPFGIALPLHFTGVLDRIGAIFR